MRTAWSTVAHAPDPADDVWALEEWLSREDEYVEGDTWHAGTSEVGRRGRRAVRLFIAGWRR